MKSEPIHLTVAAVRAIRAQVPAAHGGGAGGRDEALLQSAVAAPQATFGGEPIMGDVIEVDAADLFHLRRNHPFVDDNRRTALAACLVFLDRDGALAVDAALDVDAWEALVRNVAASLNEPRRQAWAPPISWGRTNHFLGGATMKQAKTSIAIAAVATIAIAGAASAQDANTMRLMTGPQGGVWVPLGGSLKNLWEKNIAGVSVQTLPGAGIANVRAIDEGKAEIGFGNSISTVDGLNGVAPFPRKTTNVCQLATLYPQYFQVVVNADAGINSVKDFKGKGLAVQTRGNTAEVITKQLLEVHGLKYEDMRTSFLPSYTDAAELLKNGQAQVFTLGTTIPASSIMDLATSRDVKLLDLRDSLDGMRKLNAGYYGIELPANTYPKQGAAVTNIGYAAHLIVSCKLPEQRVYEMMKVVQANFRDLVLVNKAMDGVGPKEMAVDIGVPFHPGAARFYAEQGIKVGS